jgi:GT2 family glycosyltransferase
VALASGPGVRVIANRENRGFAGGVNQGVAAASAPLILLLNPDAHLAAGLSAMAAHFRDPQVGAVGGMLTGTDGLPQQGFMVRRFPTPRTLIFEVLAINRLRPGNATNWHYRCLDFNPMVETEVDQPAGAFVLFSREAWASVGGFDEKFWPVWFEDFGWRVLYCPEVRAIHAGAHSVSTLNFGNREKYWYGNLLEYAAKHYTTAAFRAVCIAVAIGAGFRAIARIPGHGLNAIAVYSKVLALSVNRLWHAGKDAGKSLS